MHARHVRIEMRGGSMSTWIRQFHRWVSAAFVLSTVATTIALTRPEPVAWMAYVPLAPLALLALTGLYLFCLPYADRWRSRRR